MFSIMFIGQNGTFSFANDAQNKITGFRSKPNKILYQAIAMAYEAASKPSRNTRCKDWLQQLQKTVVVTTRGRAKETSRMLRMVGLILSS